MVNEYQLVVIGSGPGGYVAAIRAAQLGMKVAVVEGEEVGGTCLNCGCIPTKTLMHSTELLQQLKHSQELGVIVQDVQVDFPQLHRRKQGVVEQLVQGIKGLFQGNNIAYIHGWAVIEGAGRVRVGEQILTTDFILIATGAKPVMLPIEGIDLPEVVTSNELLMGEGRQFDRLVIIGGGVIGVEMASIYQELGCSVTIIEGMNRILPNLDREISQNLTMILKRRGIEIITSSMVERIEAEDGVTCHYTDKSGTKTVSSDGVLVAIGRQAYTQGLFAAGVEVPMERGKIIVDESFETGIKGIYAIGDVTHGSIQLAHVASAQGLNAVAHMVGREPFTDLTVIPSCIYTSPEIASVGINADEAKEQGIPVNIGKFIMSANGKNVIEMAERGVIKVVTHQETGIILGAQLMCPRATDLVSEFSLAIKEQLTWEQMAGLIHPHPTFSEGILEAVECIGGHGIHTMPKKKPMK